MKFIAEDDLLTIRLEKIEIFLALQRKLLIPRKAIAKVEWHSEYAFDTKIWRVAGSGIPGLIYAGHFRGSAGRYFLYLRGAQGITWMNGNVGTKNTLVITLQDWQYAQILLTCRENIGNELEDWWRNPSDQRST
jgi:hypothetical protein